MQLMADFLKLLNQILVRKGTGQNSARQTALSSIHISMASSLMGAGVLCFAIPVWDNFLSTIRPTPISRLMICTWEKSAWSVLGPERRQLHSGPLSSSFRLQLMDLDTT